MRPASTIFFTLLNEPQPYDVGRYHRDLNLSTQTPYAHFTLHFRFSLCRQPLGAMSTTANKAGAKQTTPEGKSITAQTSLT